MNAPAVAWSKLAEAWDHFFFTPTDARSYSHVRIGFAFLVLVHAAAMYPSLSLFYGDSGLLPQGASRSFVHPYAWTVFQVLPKSDAVLFGVFWLSVFAAFLLLIGCFSRFAAIATYVCLVSFQHRNDLILDGEDVVFRIVGFLLIFMPLKKFYSVDRSWSVRRGTHSTDLAWPAALRVLQVYICFLVFCAGLWKLKSDTWIDGDAMFYIMRLDDFFGRFPIPAFFMEYLPLTRGLTWAVLVVECTFPFLVWIRETRRTALVGMFAFHLLCDYTMHLFFFPWILMLGWSSFLDLRPRDFSLGTRVTKIVS